MSAVYPASIIAFTTKTNKVDLVDASHINALQDEVVAIETELGKQIKEVSLDLKSRLNVCLAGDGAIVNSPSFPSVPVGNQIFVKSDDVYLRNKANNNWNKLTSAYTLLSVTTFSAASNSGTITLAAGRRYKVQIKMSKSGNDAVILRFNGDSGTNYKFVTGGYGAGAAAAFEDLTGQTSIILTPGANTSGEVDITLEIVPSVSTNATVSVFAHSYFDDSGGLATRLIKGRYVGGSNVTSFIIDTDGTNTITGTIYTDEIAIS